MSITKGKKERIELAATEKAKVCTSVRIRYLKVESSKLDEGRRGAGLVDERSASALGTTELGGVDTVRHHRTRGGE